MTFAPCSRPMFCELFGPLVGLDEEWRLQGAGPEEIAMTAFDWDYVPYVECGGEAGPLVGLPTTISEDEDCLIQRDGLGRTLKLFKKDGHGSPAARLPRPHDGRLAAAEASVRILREPHSLGRGGLRPGVAGCGALVVGRLPGAWDTARELMGEEVACMAYYEQPELMQDILDTLTDTAVRTFERITERLVIDQLYVHEDLAGKSGPLMGPVHVTRFFQPYFRRVWDLLACAARGCSTWIATAT